MTLFAKASAKPGDVFTEALQKLCGGEMDPATLRLLSK
jgi:uncharacterized protein (DUF1810 family)